MKKHRFGRRATCIHCDFEGFLEIQGAGGNPPASRIFRYREHNPFSGHMLYQCPQCHEMLFADPMDVLSKESIPDVRSKLKSVDLFQKIFPMPQNSVLWKIAAIFMLLWLLGMMTGLMMHSFIHVLLVLALIIIIYGLDASHETSARKHMQVEAYPASRCKQAS
jgi:hypothetical protein